MFVRVSSQGKNSLSGSTPSVTGRILPKGPMYVRGTDMGSFKIVSREASLHATSYRRDSGWHVPINEPPR